MTAAPSTARGRWPGHRRRCSSAISASSRTRPPTSSACRADPLCGPAFQAVLGAIIRGAGSQSGLWSSSISGDLPIVLLRIDDIGGYGPGAPDPACARILADEAAGVDLVIINERASSYTQDLQIAIETAVRSSQSRLRQEGEQSKGAVFVLRADLISAETRALLMSCARVVLVARQGSLGQRLALLPKPEAVKAPPAAPLPSHTGSLPVPRGTRVLQRHWRVRQGRTGICRRSGGRAHDARALDQRHRQSGLRLPRLSRRGGYTWAENSRENQITPWSNDPVSDPAGEAIYVCDEETGEVSTATATPIRDRGTYVARHGFGYSRFEHEAQGLHLELVQFVPLADPVKISRLTIRNMSDRPRRLSVTAYAEWVLGTSRGASAPFVSTSIDQATGAMLARNPCSIALSGRVAFCDMAGAQESLDRRPRRVPGNAGTPRSSGGPRRAATADGGDWRGVRSLRRPAADDIARHRREHRGHRVRRPMFGSPSRSATCWAGTGPWTWTLCRR